MADMPKSEEIRKTLAMQNKLFDPSACPKEGFELQFVFNEEDGTYPFRLSARNGESSVREGYAARPACTVTTDLETWLGANGGFAENLRAILAGKLKVAGNFGLFRKAYSGIRDWKMPAGLFRGDSAPRPIRKVLLLNCSPRGERGATGEVSARFAEGMRRAGAEVETMEPARMRIKPCSGCFACWKAPLAPCAFAATDEMGAVLDAYRSADLVVWATPIYHYHCSTAMKTVMDRLFVNADPHVVRDSGHFRHPRKVERLPAYALLAVGGFPDLGIFDPLLSTFKALSDHAGILFLGAIRRHTSMVFAGPEPRLRGKDRSFAAIEAAGREIVALGRLRPGTKRRAEASIAPTAEVMARANALNGRFA